MKTPLLIMERSGMAHQQKYQILANELNRRLTNIQRETIPKEEINQKIEQFIKELKNSGYDRNQAKEIVTNANTLIFRRQYWYTCCWLSLCESNGFSHKKFECKVKII